MQFSLPHFDVLSQLFAANPSLFIMQLCMVFVGILLVYIVLFTTRDVLIRSDSFLYQLGMIIVVAVLPVLGFLLYVLIRPATTCRQRKFEHDVREILKHLHVSGNKKQQPQQQGKPHKEKHSPQHFTQG